MSLYLSKQHDGTACPFSVLPAWENIRPGEAEPG
jgi:hypothetical protein